MASALKIKCPTLLLVPLIELKGGDWLKFGGNNVDLGRKYMRVE